MPKGMDKIIDQLNSFHRRIREQEFKGALIKSRYQEHQSAMVSLETELESVLGQVTSLQEECANLMNEYVRTADLIQVGDNHIEKAAQNCIALEQDLKHKVEPASVVLSEERSSDEKTVGDVPVQSEENKGKGVVAFDTDGDEARQQIQPEKTSELLEE